MQDRPKTAEEISTDAATNAAHNRQLPFFMTDQNVRKQNVYPDVPREMLCRLSLTCTRAAAETTFQRLLHCAVGAEPESYQQADETSLAAIAILKRHPEFLFAKGMVFDHFGRKIFASPYRLLLGAVDKWALKQVHKEIIPMIENGEAIAAAQFQEQFPHCELPFNPELGEAALHDKRNKKMIERVINQLKTVVDMITDDPCTNGEASDVTTAAVAVLREIFAPKQGEVIKTGLHFPLAIMQEIVKVYVAAQWDLPRLSYFSREVIGAALDASTAVDGQCYKVGLRNLNFEKGPDRRDGLFCRHPKGIPQELAPLKGKLGRTMFVDPYDGESCFQSSNKPGYFDCFDKNGPWPARAAVWRSGAWLRAWKTYVEQKLHTFRTYAAAPRREDVSVCNLLK